MTAVWDSHMIFWAPPNGLAHFSSFALCSTHTYLLASGSSTSLLLLFLGTICFMILASLKLLGSLAAPVMHFHQ